MKRIILKSISLIILVTLNSCTTDDLVNNSKNEKLKISAETDSENDQNGQLTTPQSKPK